jgi:hypothetical protein
MTEQRATIIDEQTIARVLERSTVSVGDVLENLRAVIDLRERLAALDRDLSARKQTLELALIQHHESSGVDSLSGGGVSVSFDDHAMRARYDPDRWEDIVRWAVATNNLHCIQRRLTDSRIEDLIAEGVALPDGLTLETYTRIAVRRK